MRKTAMLFAATLALATGFLASSAVASGRPGTTVRVASAPTTLPIKTVPSTPSIGSNGTYPPSGTILMIKLYVGNVNAGEKFYGAVFGARPAIRVGDVPIVTFPKGGAGLVLLKKGPHDRDKVGGFIIQVPSLSAARALAVAHGAKVEGNFAGNPGGKLAQSIDLLDPWGNNVEILQLG